MKFKIDRDTVQLLVSYLEKRPYVEVYKLIEYLLRLEKIEGQEDA